MNESKIKLGTKIKMLEDALYWSKGAIGVISNDSTFHTTGEIKDSDGQFWANIQGSRAEICCLNIKDFKVLKY